MNISCRTLGLIPSQNKVNDSMYMWRAPPPPPPAAAAAARRAPVHSYLFRTHSWFPLVVLNIYEHLLVWSTSPTRSETRDGHTPPARASPALPDQCSGSHSHELRLRRPSCAPAAPFPPRVAGPVPDHHHQCSGTHSHELRLRRAPCAPAPSTRGPKWTAPSLPRVAPFMRSPRAT